jgi:hypothetical protein
MELQPDQKRLVALMTDFKEIFEQAPQGRRILDHLKERFHFSTTTAVYLQGQPMITADASTIVFNEGQRSVVVYILGMIEADVARIMADIQAANEAKRKAQAELDDLGV